MGRKTFISKGRPVREWNEQSDSLKLANPRNTKNNNATGSGRIEDVSGGGTKLLNHYEKGNDFLILSRPSSEKRRTFTSFPIVPSSFRFFVTFQLRNGRIIPSLSSPLSVSPLLPPIGAQRTLPLRNNENVIFRDAYYHHRQDTVSLLPLSLSRSLSFSFFLPLSLSSSL